MLRLRLGRAAARARGVTVTRKLALGVGLAAVAEGVLLAAVVAYAMHRDRRAGQW